MKKLIITSQYGMLSRGRHSARKVLKDRTLWAEKDEYGRIIINEPGRWFLFSSDGFAREARATIIIEKDGNWRIVGDTKRFTIVEDF